MPSIVCYPTPKVSGLLNSKRVLAARGHQSTQLGLLIPAIHPADSKCVLTACDDMHAHLYDAEHGELIEAFSGACRRPHTLVKSSGGGLAHECCRCT